MYSDLIEKRNIYSSRAYYPMAFGIISGGYRVLLMSNNEKWREIRKVMHSILQKNNASVFAEFQELESKHLLYDYLHSPDTWYKSNARFANSVMLSVVFGRRLLTGDPHTEQLLQTSRTFVKSLVPRMYLVESFPVLERLPKLLQWWRPEGERALAETLR